MKKRVLLGMSGGIDSTVSAYLLKEQGYEVVGLFMKYWTDPDFNKDLAKNDKISENKCCSLEAQMIAHNTCKKLGIEFHTENVIGNFYDDVVKYFLEIHKKGLTPNPCVQCNEKIKWGDILKKLEKFNCDFISTGHYSKIVEKKEKKFIKMPKDFKKDQTYFLSVLKHGDLDKIIFPLGDLKKEKVKEMAKSYGELEVFKKRESVGVCFYNEESYIPFLKRHIPEMFVEGDFVLISENGEEKIIGKHKGFPFYTIGQRKGIGIGGFENAMFVIGFRKKENQVLIGEKSQCFSDVLEVCDLQEMDGFFEEKNIKVRIRHLGEFREVLKIEKKDEKIFKIFLKEKIFGVSPGQFAIFYSEDFRIIGKSFIIG